MDKNAIKKYAVWARRELIARVAQRAALYEITEGGFGDPDAQTAHGRVLTDEEKAQRQALVARIRQEGYQQVMEEVAYTWFNRFIALRFMEVNGYLPSRVRVFTDENNQFKPQILAEAMNLELDGLDPQEVYAFKNANDDDGLFKYMIIVQCNALSAILPGMFQRISDYTELLFPDNLLREGSVVEQMISAIPEDDWRDAVQIIGWLYQYYISEKHDEVVNINKGAVKQEDIPAATQLFTPDWVVRYMVDNSVGRYWIERHPNSSLADKLQFFVKPKNGVIPSVNESITPQEVTFLDPCMGSGHILAYAFDVLMEIYKEYGYTEREAAAEIVQHNLHGLDIDERCTQLADFVVMMKARQYDRRFFSRGIRAQVYCPKEDQELVDFGALIQVKELGDEPKAPEELTLFNLNHANQLNDWNYRRILSQKYAVVCTNPPYLNKYNDKLKKFVTENYKDYSGDLFSVFIYRNFGFCKTDGYSAFMTPFVWMFIKTYEKLREYIINNKSITSLIQMEYSAFEEATVPICSFVLQNCKSEKKSLCFRLSDFKGGMEVQKEKVLEALQNPDCGYFYEAQQSNFSKIPGIPVAYWVSEKFIQSFSNSSLGDVVISKAGVVTGNDPYFVRFWFEVNEYEIEFNPNKTTIFPKYAIMQKGGPYRRYYGNHEYVIKLSDLYDDSKVNSSVRRGDKNYYFAKGIGWSQIGSNQGKSFRLINNSVCGTATPTIYTNESDLYYLLGLLNTPITDVVVDLSNPTINLLTTDICKIPYIKDTKIESVVNSLVVHNIQECKNDWDSFETSWDFKKHPLLRLKGSAKFIVTDGDNKPESYSLRAAYRAWEAECDDRFAQLKANEEALNRIFIDIYGLQDELKPEVSDKDVTVHFVVDSKEDIPASMQGSNYILTKRDMIVSLISYAVGCMFGRYSLDVEGLAYAGGEWDAGKYTTFPADKDNIIPICDDEYFEDDIVGRFVKFIETVYGSDTLEENLKFIADALGGKGTSRDVIRSYFLDDFYTDHCKTYQKRPIYWLFDSGKKNGFKALIYMHRYQPDTIARIRTDYVHEQQARYRTAIADLESRIAAAATGERVKLNKQLKKLQEQDAELRTYEEKIHHLADQMIAIDLDDGVKVNYAKFQDVLAKIK